MVPVTSVPVVTTTMSGTQCPALHVWPEGHELELQYVPPSYDGPVPEPTHSP